MRKGLPAVKAGDGRMPGGGDKADGEEYAIDDDDSDAEAQEKMDEDEAAAEMAEGKPNPNITPSGQAIPALDEEQEYEWKWKVCSRGVIVALTFPAQDGGVSEDFLLVGLLVSASYTCRVVWHTYTPCIYILPYQRMHLDGGTRGPFQLSPVAQAPDPRSAVTALKPRTRHL